MDAFFPNYCSVCDKSLDSSSNSLYCSNECKLKDACEKHHPVNCLAKSINKHPIARPPLHYPSVLNCNNHCCRKQCDRNMGSSASSLLQLPRLDDQAYPSSIPDLVLSEDEESATEDYDIPALSLACNLR